jgi:hypothetical protein
LKPPNPTNAGNHWQLADGTEVEILNWLDDHWMIPVGGHRRPPCGLTRRGRQLHRHHQHPRPADLHADDNGSIYTAQFTDGHNEFELLFHNPASSPPKHFRIRHDTVDDYGKLTLRYASRLHHLSIGAAHAARWNWAANRRR